MCVFVTVTSFRIVIDGNKEATLTYLLLCGPPQEIRCFCGLSNSVITLDFKCPCL